VRAPCGPLIRSVGWVRGEGEATGSRRGEVGGEEESTGWSRRRQSRPSATPPVQARGDGTSQSRPPAGTGRRQSRPPAGTGRRQSRPPAGTGRRQSRPPAGTGRASPGRRRGRDEPVQAAGGDGTTAGDERSEVAARATPLVRSRGSGRPARAQREREPRGSRAERGTRAPQARDLGGGAPRSRLTCLCGGCGCTRSGDGSDGAAGGRGLKSPSRQTQGSRQTSAEQVKGLGQGAPPAHAGRSH